MLQTALYRPTRFLLHFIRRPWLLRSYKKRPMETISWGMEVLTRVNLSLNFLGSNRPKVCFT